MTHNYFDTHAHLIKDYFNDEQIKDLVLKAKKAGVNQIIVPSTTLEDWIQVQKVTKKYQHLHAAFGIHPSEAQKENDHKIFKNIKPQELIALGEVGIDLYHQKNPSLAIQKNLFILFCDYALKHNLPLLIHMRQSEVEIYQILSQSKYKKLKFIIHCFTSTYDWALKFIELGALISFSGIITFKNAKNLQEVVKRLPLDKIICETDTPYLSPVPYRGKTNQPLYVVEVANFIAKLRPEEKNVVLEKLYQNAINFFGIKK